MHGMHQRHKVDAELYTQPMSFREGDRDLLRTKNLRSRDHRATRLLPRFVGHVLVTACFGNQAFAPAVMHIHHIVPCVPAEAL